MTNYIAFLGESGSYSDLAARNAASDYTPLPCASFDAIVEAVHSGKAALAILPVENSIAGRVADVHQLMPNSGLSFVGEHYQPIEHHLLALPGTKLEEIKTVMSHEQPLAQCRQWLKDKGIAPLVKSSTTAAAQEMKDRDDKSIAVIGSSVAGEIYGLESIAENIADLKGNTTRFLIAALAAVRPDVGTTKCITSIIFRVRSVPAALYKALGGFATNGVNITKLESYLVDGKFTAAQFYIDVEGHPEEISMQNALEELQFFAHEMNIIGTYPASPFRIQGLS